MRVYICNRNLPLRYRILRPWAMLLDALIHLLSFGFLGSSFQLDVIREGTKAWFKEQKNENR